MAMRLTGLMSGMDTESIVQELVAVRRTKVDKLVKEQTKLEWKQDAWKELNGKVKKLFSGAMSNLRFEGSYVKKTTKVSDSSIAEVIADDTAMNSVQTLEVNKLAQTGYLTGATIQKTDGSKCTSATKLTDLGMKEGSSIEITTQGKTTAITVEKDMTLKDLTKKLSEAGVNANFDSKTQRLFVGAKESGAEADFTITAANDDGTDALNKLGILVYEDAAISQYREYAKLRTGSGTADDPYVYSEEYTKLLGEDATPEQEAVWNAKIDKAQAVVAEADALPAGQSLKGSDAIKLVGQDAEIRLNGALFISNSNTFEINGLTITCNAETKGKEVTLTTQNDTSGIYDMIKSFIKEYGELIGQMDKLYNAEMTRGFEPLTDEEKSAMSEEEVEKWEQKIKDSLLRRDSSLNSISSAYREIMASGFEVNGQTMFLSNFGIETLGYFEAADNERNIYHINGDEDDEYKSTEANKLMAMISSDPDAVVDFFTQLSKALYNKTNDLMKSVEGYKSGNTVYEDKKLKSDYDDYKDKIADMEDKLADYEEKWYAKFADMETAMAKMQSNSNAVVGMLGGM